MKKILASLAIIAVVSASTVSATQAYFSDTETSVGNTITAGTLRLTVNDQEGQSVPVLIDGYINPGDYRGLGVVTLKNVGTVPGRLSVSISNIVNTENPHPDPSISGDPGLGELGPKLSVIVKRNFYDWDSFQYMTGLYTGATLSVSTMTGSPAPVLNSGESQQFQLNAQWVPTSTDNQAQGDAVRFDLTFRLDQVI